MSPTIGFLWDSLSVNLGDRAIGLTLVRLAEGRGFRRLSPVRIGEEELPGSHPMLIIGGGEILRPAGHPFYDLFRVPGEHVLNAAGTGDAVEAGYLASYRRVAVRSRWDAGRLVGFPGPAAVVPCQTVLFPQVAAPTPRWGVPAGTLGLHLNAASVPAETARARRALAALPPDRARLLSLTPYNLDFEVAGALARELGWAPPVVPRGPDEALQLIRELQGLVTTSLHATLFAYAAGVPFLALDYAPKVRAFLAERGLAHRLLAAVEEVPERLHLLAPGSCDWEETLAADRKLAEAHLEALLAEAESALAAPAGSRALGAVAARGTAEGAPWSPPSHPVEAHRLMMGEVGEYGRRIAERIAYEAEQERARQHYQALEERLAPASVHAVIVHHRGRELLARCLTSLLASGGPELQVIVVANASPEPLPEPAGGEARVHAVACPEPLSFAAANNRGVAWAEERLGRPDYYLFLNDDTVVEEGALALLVAALERDPGAGVAGPRLMIWGAPDRLNSLGLQVTRDGCAWDEGIGQRLADYGPLPPRREVLAVTGSALLIRAPLLARLGGWEGIFEYYYEDVDLCLRAWQAAAAVIHVPEAVVWHAISATAGGRAHLKTALMGRNRFLLMAIHWPAALLARVVPRLLASELRVFVRRLRAGAREDARRQARSWWGALSRLRPAFARRRRVERRREWLRFLQAPGSVPPIELPDPAVRGALAPEEVALAAGRGPRG